MDLDELKKYEALKEDIRKEVEDDIISKVKVNDSVFYGELIVSKSPISVENPFTECYQIVAVLNLYNSQDFSYPHMTNDRRELSSKRIVLKENVDLDDISDCTNPNVLMPIFYEMLSKKLAQELISELGKNWHQYLYNPYQSKLRMKG